MLVLESKLQEQTLLTAEPSLQSLTIPLLPGQITVHLYAKICGGEGGVNIPLRKQLQIISAIWTIAQMELQITGSGRMRTY